LLGSFNPGVSTMIASLINGLEDITSTKDTKGEYLPSAEKADFTISQMNFLKITIVLNAVAKCNTTVMSIDSSPTEFSPNMYLAISKWPLLDTGKNSVRPCTIPNTMDLIISIIKYEYVVDYNLEKSTF
jgi:hypothetical protein